MDMMPLPDSSPTEGQAIAARVERFVREVVIPCENDPRRDVHGPTDALVQELRGKAREAGVLTPHILPDGRHLSHRDTAVVLRAAGLSLLGPLAVNVNAPDEGNMYLLGHDRHAPSSRPISWRTAACLAEARSAFFMTEPWDGRRRRGRSRR